MFDGLPRLSPVKSLPVPSWHRSRGRVAAAVAFFLAATVVAVATVVAWSNPWSLIVLRDHAGPGLSLLAVVVCCVLVTAGTLVLVRPGARWRALGLSAAGSAVFFVVFAVVVLAVRALVFAPGDVVDRRTTPDGRYEVRVLLSLAVIDERWDFVIARVDGGRFREVHVGCVSSDANGYEGIRALEPGLLRIGVHDLHEEDARDVDVRFDPVTMEVIQPIPDNLC